MSGGNFNWFLHTMLFMHTMYVIQKQEAKGENEQNKEDDEDEAAVDIDEEAE
jgi:hypothetical protein